MNTGPKLHLRGVVIQFSRRKIQTIWSIFINKGAENMGSQFRLKERPSYVDPPYDIRPSQLEKKVSLHLLKQKKKEKGYPWEMT